MQVVTGSDQCLDSFSVIHVYTEFHICCHLGMTCTEMHLPLCIQSCSVGKKNKSCKRKIYVKKKKNGLKVEVH